MGEAFDQVANYYNVLYSSVFLNWVIGLILLLVTPGLLGFALRSYRYSRTELLGLYISRFVPYPLYVMGVELANSLSGATIILILLAKSGFISTTNSWDSYLFIWLGALLVVLSSFIIRHISYQTWSFVFIPSTQSKYLAQDYFSITLLRAIALLFLQLIALAPLPEGWLIPLCIAVLAPLQLLRIVQAVRRLWGNSGGYIYIFLYICTHELLPIYVLLLLELILEGGFHLQIQPY